MVFGTSGAFSRIHCWVMLSNSSFQRYYFWLISDLDWMFFTGKQGKKELLENSKLPGDTWSFFNKDHNVMLKTSKSVLSSLKHEAHKKAVPFLTCSCSFNDLFSFVQEHLTWSVVEALACLRDPALMVCLLMVYLPSVFCRTSLSANFIPIRFIERKIYQYHVSYR